MNTYKIDLNGSTETWSKCVPPINTCPLVNYVQF